MRIYHSVFVCILMLAGQSVSAAILSLNPADSLLNQGDSFSVDLRVSDLGASSLGAFNVQIDFDDSLIAYESVVYSENLGNTDPAFFETDILTTLGAGSVELDNVSFLLAVELDALQSAEFVLATLSFKGVAPGLGGFNMTALDIADAIGGDLTSSTVTQPATYEVREVTSVPLPSTLLLFMSSGLLLFRVKKA